MTFKIESIDTRCIGVSSGPVIVEAAIKESSHPLMAYLISFKVNQQSVLETFLEMRKDDALNFEINGKSYEAQYLHTENEEYFYYCQ